MRLAHAPGAVRACPSCIIFTKIAFHESIEPFQAKFIVKSSLVKNEWRPYSALVSLSTSNTIENLASQMPDSLSIGVILEIPMTSLSRRRPLRVRSNASRQSNFPSCLAEQSDSLDFPSLSCWARHLNSFTSSSQWRGRTGQGSSPCSTPLQSRARTSPWSPRMRRLPPRPGVGSSNRR